MLNCLKLGLDKGHVMHFMDQWQPIMFARVCFFLPLYLFETETCLFNHLLCLDSEVDLICYYISNVLYMEFVVCKSPFIYNSKCLEFHSLIFSVDVFK